jgi:hypothetical protein
MFLITSQGWFLGHTSDLLFMDCMTSKELRKQIWRPNDNLMQKCTVVPFWIGEIMKPSCLECRTAHRQTSSQGQGWDISSYSNCYYYIWTQIYKHSHFSCTFDFLEPSFNFIMTLEHSCPSNQTFHFTL